MSESGICGRAMTWILAGAALVACGGAESSSDSGRKPKDASGGTSGNGTTGSGGMAGSSAEGSVAVIGSSAEGGESTSGTSNESSGGLFSIPGLGGSAPASATTDDGLRTACSLGDREACLDSPAGSRCVELDQGTRCGCASSGDCANGMNCDLSARACSADPSVPLSCALGEGATCAGIPLGFICIEAGRGEHNHCGCTAAEDCPEGMDCDAGPRTCTAADAPASCRLESDECAGNPQGDECMESPDSPYNSCGCVNSDDCPAGSSCNSEQRVCN